MQLTIDETNRRRTKQMQYNTEHGITPTRIRKTIKSLHEGKRVDYLEKAYMDADLNRAAEETDVFFAVKSLEYLYKGGRIGKAIYRLGTALNIKPVLMCDKEGYYTIAKKARGWDRSLDTMIAVAAATAARYDSVRLAICCSSATSPLYKPLEERLRAAIDNIASIQTKDLSADLIVHTGPDLVGVGVQNAAL
jgi:DegV family protein with EDD domain